MNTKILSESAIDVINQYKNFQVENAICSVPYFNNKTTARRAGLRAEVGKGSPKDIFDEVEQRAFEQKIDLKNLDSVSLKKFLVDNNIGIDCSGFVFNVLDLSKKNIYFDKGIFGKIKAMIRPAMNTDVKTLAHNKNSKAISLLEIQVGDIITMINNERDHVILVNQIEYQNFKPTTIHYAHAVAWPTDGEYGHGIHEGKIEILDLNKSLLEQRWIENNVTNSENYTLTRAQKSVTEIRRLNWF